MATPTPRSDACKALRPPQWPLSLDEHLFLAIGVITGPANQGRRRWLRQHAFGDVALRRREVVARFVLSAGSARCGEAQRYGDIVALAEATDDDGPMHGCVDKAFAWYSYAIAAWPTAAFIAKMDDDTALVSLSNAAAVAMLLSADAPQPPQPPPAQQRRARDRHSAMIFAGFIQYASFLPEVFRGCGWSPIPKDALAGAVSPRSTCHSGLDFRHLTHTAASGGRAPNVTVRGPFPFAAGMLQLLSAPLARLTFGHAWTRAFAARARNRTLPWPRKWVCQNEDITIGYAVHETTSRTNASVSVVALRGHGVSARPLLADEAEAVRERLPVEQLLAVHHFDPVEASLMRGEREEDEQNQRLKLRGTAPIPHKHEHAAFSRALRPRLEAIASARAAAAAAAGTSVVANASLRRAWLHMRCGRRRLVGDDGELRDLACCRSWRLCSLQHRRLPRDELRSSATGASGGPGAVK